MIETDLLSADWFCIRGLMARNPLTAGATPFPAVFCATRRLPVGQPVPHDACFPTVPLRDLPDPLPWEMLQEYDEAVAATRPLRRTP